VTSGFRQGFYGGLGVALFMGLLLVWLWQPERQVRRHSSNLLRAVQQKNWARAANFIGSDYRDQWGDDRMLVLERMREVFRYLRSVRIETTEPSVRLDSRSGFWSAKLTIDGDGDEVMQLVKERVNSLKTPFELEWRRMSSKPWDWKLVRVANQNLEIAPGFE
jgi:hypothetical protein